MYNTEIDRSQMMDNKQIQFQEESNMLLDLPHVRQLFPQLSQENKSVSSCSQMSVDENGLNSNDREITKVLASMAVSDSQQSNVSDKSVVGVNACYRVGIVELKCKAGDKTLFTPFTHYIKRTVCAKFEIPFRGKVVFKGLLEKNCSDRYVTRPVSGDGIVSSEQFPICLLDLNVNIW